MRSTPARRIFLCRESRLISAGAWRSNRIFDFSAVFLIAVLFLESKYSGKYFVQFRLSSRASSGHSEALARASSMVVCRRLAEKPKFFKFSALFAGPPERVRCLKSGGSRGNFFAGTNRWGGRQSGARNPPGRGQPEKSRFPAQSCRECSAPRRPPEFPRGWSRIFSARNGGRRYGAHEPRTR